jgi:hypothetical protein
VLSSHEKPITRVPYGNSTIPSQGGGTNGSKVDAV